MAPTLKTALTSSHLNPRRNFSKIEFHVSYSLSPRFSVEKSTDPEANQSLYKINRVESEAD